MFKLLGLIWQGLVLSVKAITSILTVTNKGLNEISNFLEIENEATVLFELRADGLKSEKRSLRLKKLSIQKQEIHATGYDEQSTLRDQIRDVDAQIREVDSKMYKLKAACKLEVEKKFLMGKDNYTSDFITDEVSKRDREEAARARKRFKESLEQARRAKEL